jgi:lipoate-protein ligase A
MPGQCFAGWEQFDLLWAGKKIAGAAQRRNKQGLLIQGSIQPPPIALAKADWQKAMCDVAHEQFGSDWSEFIPDTKLNQHAADLARTKYSQPDFIGRR